MLAWDLCILTWLGWNTAEKEAVTTEQFVVLHVLLSHIQTWHLFQG